jgi:hypothetical protein
MSVDLKPALVSVPPSPLFCTLIVSYFKGFVKRFFTFFLLAFPSLCGGTSLPLDCQRNFSQAWYSLSPLDTLIVSQLGQFVKGFLEIFSRKFVSWKVGSTQLLRTVRPSKGSQLLGGSLPLTPIVYHAPPQKSTWQSAQIRASKLFNFCTTFLLTNCWRYSIMEISDHDKRGRAAKKIEQKFLF